ncbi:putative Protein kinase [Leptomonas seymouri]|uniref:Protein kinase domain-containing protein n=1 Tax=Leptomonas seymouri TaxID=5684 RepID=A0A0N1IJY2_LEPSE|nr:putative Protein kinase [Leptomonas seymouri]|eukprot:KPI86153.1 putative Protein kinase [Leptomonas seymouri]
MPLFPLPKPDLRSPSPVWSAYDEGWGGDEPDVKPDLFDESAIPGSSRHAAQRYAYISYPPLTTTLKGGYLKKKAPIRRGAQGAVYAAYDTSVTAPDWKARAARVEGTKENVAMLPLDSSQHPPPTGALVAVKRIFIQSNDFGARDISATVLREVTLHRFVCAQEDRYLAKDHGAVVSPSCGALDSAEGRAESAKSAFHVGGACLIDDSARMLRLHRIVEAPHKEMCLVLELTATNLETLLAPPAGHGTGRFGGGLRRKPGTVTLFGRFGTAADGETNFGLPTGVGSVSGSSTAGCCSTMGPSGGSTRCPLLSQLPLVRYVMRRLLRLVCFLHEECGVVHRDLKPSNVLVAEDGGLRLGDFGSSRFAPPTKRNDTLPELSSAHATVSINNGYGAAVAPAAKESFECTPPSMRTTLHYRPPEVIFGDQSCGPAADVWALGVMFAEMLLQKNLFHVKSELDLLGSIQKLLGVPAKTPSWMKPAVAVSADDVAEPQDEESAQTEASSGAPFAVTTATMVQASLPCKLHAGIVPAEGLDLVARMLNQLPGYRLTVREAMAHPFLNPGNADAKLTREDDKAGELIWKEKVTQVLQNVLSAESVSATGLDRSSLQKPMFLGLGDDEDDDDDREDEENDGLGAPALFRLNLSGEYSTL